jgi:cell division FtsZ-interacting protein ZapD
VDALEKAELWKRDKLKEHFVELSYILRSYLTSRYDLNLLDKTTYETKLLLTAKNIDKEVIESILKVLNHSDMVKFAASKPGEEIVEKSFFMIRQLIVETSPIEYEHA